MNRFGEDDASAASKRLKEQKRIIQPGKLRLKKKQEWYLQAVTSQTGRKGPQTDVKDRG